MKLFIKPIVFLFAFATGLSFNGCILDAFDTLIQNIPISQSVILTSSQTSASASANFDVSTSSVYQEYIKSNKIQKISFAKATFVTATVTPSTLQADFTIVLKTQSGTQIFSKTFTGIKPSNYMGDASVFNLQLTDTELNTLNSYLDIKGSKYTTKYTGIISVSNVQGFSGSYTVAGKYDVALTLEVNTK